VEVEREPVKIDEKKRENIKMKDRFGNRIIIKHSVWDCKNYKRISVTIGDNCWACGMRKGYPYYAQPDKNCENFKIKSKNEKQ